MGNPQRPEVDWTYGSAKIMKTGRLVLSYRSYYKKIYFQYYFVEPQWLTLD
jgi:hypothetical protein